MKRFALIATILAAVVGCDKAKALASLGRREEPEGPPPAARLDLSRRPEILFQLFGERDDARMVPVAAIVDGTLKPIELTASGWRQFDALYTRSTHRYPLFRDGSPIGTVRVRRGMWERPNEPLYSLPGCRVVTPLAAVALETSTPLTFTVEALATTSGVSVAPRLAAKPSKALESRARAAARESAQAVGIDSTALPRSAFRYIPIHTGVARSPTLVISYLDPEASDRQATTAHLLVLADDLGDGYFTSFRHASAGAVAAAEFRRYIDHLDVTGDGIDEIVLEGWEYGGDTFITILGYANDEWREVFRGRPSWCLARPTQK